MFFIKTNTLFLLKNHKTGNIYILDQRWKVMRFNENYIRELVREAVQQHYQSYGIGKYDRNKVKPIVNRRDIAKNKPTGGLWASPVGAKFDWRAYNKQEVYRVYDDDDYFEFTIKPNARVLKLKTEDDIKKLPMQWDNPSMKSIASRYKGTIWAYPDFEELSKHYDVIDYSLNAETYEPLSGWDCDSILVLNPDVIEIVKNDNPHETSTKRKMTQDEIDEFDPGVYYG